MIRNLVVRAMYIAAETIQLAADRISPPDDEVWRDRAWRRFMMGEARKNEYATSDELRGISKAHRQCRDAVWARFSWQPCQYEKPRVRADDD